MNKRNLKDIPPRQFPKQQYTKLTHKLRLAIVIPIVVLLIGGGTVATCGYHQAHVRTQRTVHRSAKRDNPDRTRHVSQHHNKPQPITVKRGEKLLGRWLRKLNYPTAKSQAILSAYQKRNQQSELTVSQKLNRIDRSSANESTKARQIRHVINHDL